MNESKSPIHIDPEILSGTPVFQGTRVPFQALLDYLKGGDSIDEFLDDFPSVPRQQAMEALRQAAQTRGDGEDTLPGDRSEEER